MIDFTLLIRGTSARLLRLKNIVALLVLFSGACGDSPSPAPSPLLSMTCPTQIEANSTTGGPVVVQVPTPTTVGGSAPVNVTCNNPTQFPVGSTTVGCTATDAKQKTASCNFIVAVKGPPRLRFTNFLAFGDSITAGTKSDPVTLRLVPAAYAYTVLLETRLRARYTLQNPIVWNEGSGGEATNGGLVRLRPLLLQYRPEVLLLMEGTNDLFFEPNAVGISSALANLRQMIAIAKSLNIQVGLATIAPQRANGLRNRGAVAAVIPSLNDGIRALAASEGVVLIDVYAGMKDNINLIGVDDLHPTELGYSVIADTFYEAIVRAFEAPATSAQMTVH